MVAIYPTGATAEAVDLPGQFGPPLLVQKLLPVYYMIETGVVAPARLDLRSRA